MNYTNIDKQAAIEDENKIKEIAKRVNNMIIEQEGYDPVGEEWLVNILSEAYNLGIQRALKIISNA